MLTNNNYELAVFVNTLLSEVNVKIDNEKELTKWERAKLFGKKDAYENILNYLLKPKQDEPDLRTIGMITLEEEK